MSGEGGDLSIRVGGGDDKPTTSFVPTLSE